jgi:phage head maturation protease
MTDQTEQTEQQTRPAGELRYRTSELLEVSFPQRLIELVVIPYETDALVPHPRDRRMVTEVISRGAFDGVERRPNRIRVNRDHLLTRTVGRALALHPSRLEGLVAEVRIAKTELGDETLALAAEEILDASAGFLPMPGGERWEGKSRCRITKGWLAHIALTPDPAYETANVLAVREAKAPEEPALVTATPNLDRMRLDAWRSKLAELDARYGL